ncbi:MAG: leucine--tRNA ligase [Oscillospiraceae bacterium]|nr:leucine--tRNA ligase [Oscillospiraceae bacterium]
MSRYDPKSIEKKWQGKWEEARVFAASNRSEKPKYYALVEFPYPSGAGLHCGHTRPYTALDAVARVRRMQGYNVLFPIGWDAFGLPTENYAIANKIHPAEVTRRNIAVFRSQAKALGYGFDYSREVDTTAPEYYKWTQWIFLKLFEKGLAYKTDMPVNWCVSCKCVLANEEVVDGGCERCGSEVVRRDKSQWMLRITAYAQRLLDDLDTVDYPSRVKLSQKNWIGRSEGTEVDFPVVSGGRPVEPGYALRVYTTRPDTLFGATYMVVSPEHPMLDTYRGLIRNAGAVDAYRAGAARKSDFERGELNKDKSGVRLDGVQVINPVNNREIPVFVSDYVLMSYGTGAIMAVPGHDERDWAFARKFGLPVVEVVRGGDVRLAAYTDTETGVMVNSGFLDGLEVAEAKRRITAWLAEKGLGQSKVNYKLRDWVFARQRYWGEPIPIIHCPECGMVPLPESELPLTLPEVDSYEPTDTGESPLSAIRGWVETICPVCGSGAERETDTMPQWAGSSWYFLRYCDPHNQKALASQESLKYWMAVDWYNGGMEHTTLHLLYSRFWHKFLYDIGVTAMPEPYQKRTAHGIILGPDGEKMSKSAGNVANPMDVVDQYGADTMRLVILFIGDFEKAVSWSDKAVVGSRRFLERVWALQDGLHPGKAVTPALEGLLHKTVKKVTEDVENLKFNTAIAALMTLCNEMSGQKCSWADYQTLLKLLNPFAPHICEELWTKYGAGGLLALQTWPSYDPAKTLDETVEMAVQVAGKLRSTVALPRGSAEADVIAAALADARIAAIAQGREPKRSIVVPDKLVNLIF